MYLKLDNFLFDALGEKARVSDRLRMNFDLRDSENDNSQKMLNAIEPDTQIPIHRHPNNQEVVVILRGAAMMHFYDNNGVEVENAVIKPGSNCPGIVIEKNQWHRIESLETNTVVLACKEGKWEPAKDEDILNVE